MNKLEGRSRTYTSLDIVSAQKREKGREILMIIEAYMCRGWITKVLERLSLARSCLKSREYEDVLKILGRVLGVLGGGFRAERGREKRGREM